MNELFILDFIQEHLRCGFLDTVMPVITLLGEAGIFWILCTLLYLIQPKTRKTGFVMAAALVADLVLCNIILKPMVARIRPYDLNPAVVLLVRKPTDYSFPSGHTAASFAIVSALFFEKRKSWIPALILSCLIAFSRLYLYVHYPTDVLGGIAVGILAGWIGFLVVHWILRKRKAREERS